MSHCVHRARGPECPTSCHRRQSIVATRGHNRVVTQDEDRMDNAAILRNDRGRVVLTKLPKSSRVQSETLACTEDATGRPAIISAYCTNRLATQHHEPMGIALIIRSDHFRVVLRGSSESQGYSSKTTRDKKKVSRIGPPSNAKNPAKRRLTALQMGNNVHHNGSKQARTKRCWSANTGGRSSKSQPGLSLPASDLLTPASDVIRSDDWQDRPAAV